MWDYICPKCRKEVEKNSHRCVHCGELYGKSMRVPPKVLKDPKTLEDYVHKHVFPRVSESQRDYLAQFFTELFTSGWEDSGGSDVTDNGVWDGTSISSGETLEVVGSPVHHGSYALHCESDSGSSYSIVYKELSSLLELYGRVYLRVSATGTSNFSSIMSFNQSGGRWNYICDVRFTNWNGSSTRMRIFNYPASAYYDSGTFTTALDTWYCVEMRCFVNATTGILQGWLDGDLKIDRTNINTGSTQIGRIHVGINNAWAADDLYIDCVVAADTYIGPESATQTYTKTWTTDALFKKLDIQKTLNIDTALQKQDIPLTFTLDTALQKSFTTQKQIDALFQKLDILETFGVDVGFLKRNVIKSFGVDARFSALAIHTISRQIDVLLKKLDVTRTFGLDVYFGTVAAETYGKSFGLDAIFAYKVRLPELWLDENGKFVLNISKPYMWVGS